jgi:LmbE family N-acetylglucosaminyl deacetylase
VVECGGMGNLFISPHNDDECLFGAFTLCREAADIQVIIVFDGYIQAQRGEQVTSEERRIETVNALKELGVVKPPVFLGFRDDLPDWPAVLLRLERLNEIYKPVWTYIPWQEPNGHTQHNGVGHCAENVFDRCKHYTTYSTAGRTTGRTRITPEPDWIIRKLRALSCYSSQIHIANCREHFMRGLEEYYL